MHAYDVMLDKSTTWRVSHIGNLLTPVNTSGLFKKKNVDDPIILFQPINCSYHVKTSKKKNTEKF